MTPTTRRHSAGRGRGGEDAVPSPKRGDVVRFEGQEWVVTGVTFGPDGIRLMLLDREGWIVAARPRDVTLVGAQLELTEEPE